MFRSGILVAGGFCHGNPDFDECDLLRLDSTMFYDWQNGEKMFTIAMINY